MDTPPYASIVVNHTRRAHLGTSNRKSQVRGYIEETLTICGCCLEEHLGARSHPTLV